VTAVTVRTNVTEVLFMFKLGQKDTGLLQGCLNMSFSCQTLPDLK